MDISSELARSTTAHKLSSLRSQQTKLADALKRLDERIQNLIPSALINRLQAKYDTLRKSIGTKDSDFETALNSFISLAKVDPTCGPADIQKWHALVDQKLTQAQSKCSLNVVFTDVLQQWLETDAKAEVPKSTTSAQRPEISNDFEFSGKSFFSTFLNETGAPEKILQKLVDIRKRAGKLEILNISSHAVQQAMESMIKNPKQYSIEVRRQLAVELKTGVAEIELAAVYTTTLQYLDDWKWTRPMTEILQTHLNGKQRFILDIDITTAIFLEVVGRYWCSFFANELKALHDDQSWKKTTILEGLKDNLTDDDYQIYCLSMGTSKENIRECGLEKALVTGQCEEYISILQDPASYDSADNPDEAIDDDLLGWSATHKSALAAQTYKKVFQTISIDMALTKAVLPDSNYTIMHADLKDFGPSIQHQPFLSIMEFFGFSEQWIRFAKRYLQTPILQSDSSVVNSTVGAPFGICFTGLITELLLVVLDIGVMSKTGLSLSRNHDDFWFSSSDQQKVVDTWLVLNKFSEGTGLKWNMEKTGSTVVSNTSTVLETSTELPSEPLRWGLLILSSDGTWEPNYSALDERVAMAKKELASAQSVLGKINVYNKNQAFSARNCALPMIILNKDYIRLAQQAFVYFEKELTEDASFLRYIRGELMKSFPLMSTLTVPDGFFFWPVDVGGLSLQSQLINALIYQDTLNASNDSEGDENECIIPVPPFIDRIKVTKKAYQVAKKDWDSEPMKRKFNNLVAHQYDSEAAEWAHAKGTQPPFLTEEAFISLSVLFDSGWFADYEYYQTDLSSRNSATEVTYKKFLHGVFGKELVEVTGASNANEIEIISPSMIPSYALKDLKQTVKKLYS